jgi:hypothetical protein
MRWWWTVVGLVRGGFSGAFFALLVGVSACTNHTYSVNVAGLGSANVHMWLAAAGGGEVDISFSNVDPDQGCPVLADDVTLTLGGTPLTGTRGSYGELGPNGVLGGASAACSPPSFSAPTPASTSGDTTDLIVADRHNTASVTIVAPYAPRMLTTPSTLVPGTSAQFMWSVSTDHLTTSGLLLSCDEDASPGLPGVIEAFGAASYPSQAMPNEVLLSYQAGRVSFPVPANVGGTAYSGPLHCSDMLSFSTAIADCTGFLGCSAQVGAGVQRDYDPSI